jgi:2-oxopent-4-enoate/cis-2-oxohex-4-enoate hydratase
MFKTQSKMSFCLAIATLALLVSSKPMHAKNPVRDITDQLSAGQDRDAIVDHLFQARKTASVTRALALHYPDINQDEAYKIQMALLKKMQASGEKLVGWKMGGTKIVKPEDKLDPIFGFMLASDEYKSGGTAPANRFGDDTPIIEAEVGFWISKDLPGPKVSRKQLEAAIGGVGGTSELISARVRDSEGGLESGVDLAIADGLSHGGFILPKKNVPLSKGNFDTEIGSVKINGKTIATGTAKIMMEGDPLAAVLSLANRLPKHGQHLRKGDVVIIGSMLESPPAVAGDHVEIIFTSYEPLTLDIK